LAGTAVEVENLRPVLLIDSDGGSRTLRGKPRFKGIDIIRIHKFSALNKVYDMILDNRDRWRTVILDNLGQIYNLGMEDIMDEVVNQDPSRDRWVPSMREYGKMRLQIHKVLDHFSRLGLNFIVTAHAELDKDELDGTTRIRPALSGKLAYEVPGLMNIVCYLSTETGRSLGQIDEKLKKEGGGATDLYRVGFFQPHKRIDAKDTSDSLGLMVVDPTMKHIVESIGMK
jgi:hypothetical protein